MAANNYFGFTTGGNQYGSTPGQANYSTGQSASGYAVQHTAQAYSTSAAAQQPTSQSTYETYQSATHSASSYPYNARQYDKTQTYYQSPSQSYSTADTGHYQNTASNKPVYSTTNYNTRQAPTTQKVQPGTGSSYMYSSNATTGSSPTNYSTNYSNVVPVTTYSTSVYAQPSSVTTQSALPTHNMQSPTSVTTPKVHTNTWGAFKKGTRIQRPKMPPKPQQLHYCDVCKISCAGPQTYKEHLEGQKHKKKEAASKAGILPHVSKGTTTLRCELCDVTCTGSDAYAAHIRGAKHQKVVKLHTKLGKPIPSTEPQVVSTGAETKKPANQAASPPSKKTLPPKVNFVAAGSNVIEPKDESMDESDSKLDEKEIQPVGQDYIEEMKSDDGKIISFQCKLCDCRFNDPNAKEMHMKGRRHRLQYKKKVNPELIVDVKPSLKQRKIQEDKLRRQQLMDELWKRREEERWREEMRILEEDERIYWENRRRYEEELEFYEWHRRFGRDPRVGPPIPPPPPRSYIFNVPPSVGQPTLKKPETVDDRHVTAKHTQIYPKEEELNAVQKIITNSEKALKLVSDFLTEKHDKKDAPRGPATRAAKAALAAAELQNKEKEEKSENAQQYRALKGVMRVGVLAKGLVLTGDLKVQLVVMCAEKPTRTLLERVVDNLPKQLATVAPDEKYFVKRCIEEAAIIITSNTEPKIHVTVTLTSPVMRESGNTGENVEVTRDPPDVLDRQKCLEALAELRHAKWFQAKAAGIQSCVLVIRILRDLCQRVPTWGHLSGWAMELLVEKILASCGQSLSSGEALRRVFEAIASGILLPGSSGLLDPCEKEPIDTCGSLSNQEREDITASAQHALRLIAFRQIHKVLGIDQLPAPKFNRGLFARKRRRDNGEGIDAEGNKNLKKDKKDGDEEMDSSEVKA